jgi:hypothetical protein
LSSATGLGSIEAFLVSWVLTRLVRRFYTSACVE